MCETYFNHGRKPMIEEACYILECIWIILHYADEIHKQIYVYIYIRMDLFFLLATSVFLLVGRRMAKWALCNSSFV